MAIFFSLVDVPFFILIFFSFVNVLSCIEYLMSHLILNGSYFLRWLLIWIYAMWTESIRFACLHIIILLLYRCYWCIRDFLFLRQVGCCRGSEPQLDSGVIHFLVTGRNQILSFGSRKKLSEIFLLLEDKGVKQWTYWDWTTQKILSIYQFGVLSRILSLWQSFNICLGSWVPGHILLDLFTSADERSIFCFLPVDIHFKCQFHVELHN